MVFIYTRFSRPNTFWKIANHCNVLICTTNQTIVPWTVINVELSINFKVTVKWKPKDIRSLPCLMAEALKRYHR